MFKLKSGPYVISRRELASMLFDVRGATAVTITARTNPALKGGKECPLIGLEKLSRVNGMINFNYENSVNRQRERDESPLARDGSVEHFEAGPRAWGTRLISRETGRKIPLVAKEFSSPRASWADVREMPAENLYLELKVQKPLSAKYELNGVEVSEEEAKPHLRESSSPHNIVLRDYRFDHLEEISIDGNVYLVADEVPPQ